jgi:hypothetical protein
VVALFNERERAEVAIHALQQAGFSRDQLGAVLRHSEPTVDPATTEALDEEAEATGTGVAVGSVAGGLAGLLGGLALSAIPGIGPFLGAGVLAATLGGTAAGAAIGSALGERAAGLDAFGVPHERIHQYGSALHAGQIAVSVHAHTPDEVMRARELLGAHDAEEIDVYPRPEAQMPPQSQDLDAGL